MIPARIVDLFSGKFKKFIKFGIVGLSNTAVDLIIFNLLRLIPGMPDVAAKAVSYFCGIINSFFWNKYWTFRSRASAWATLIPFILTALVGLGINAGTLQLCLKTFHLPELVALGLATLITLFWNFVISKFVIFKDSSQ